MERQKAFSKGETQMNRETAHQLFWERAQRMRTFSIEVLLWNLLCATVVLLTLL